MATDTQAWDVLFALADKLGIDPEEARKADGKPSDVFMEHIGRIERERDQLAAQVEKFTNFTRFVQKCVSKNGEYAPLTGLEMRELLSVEPSKCLARRDARIKAEALEEMALMFAPESSARADCLRMRGAYLNLTKEES